MSEKSRELANPIGAADAATERDATYKVRFSKFWTTTSRRQNSFDLARRGEIAFLGDRFIVRAFRREMWFMGSRIELTFERAQVADVVRSGTCLHFSITPPGGEVQSMTLWTEDEEAAKRLAREFPDTVSPAAMEIRAYEAQLASAGRGDPVTKALVALNVLVFGAAGIGGAGFFIPNPQVLQAWGTNFGPLTTDGQWWRLVSSIFLHFGVFHLALNMWALYVGGRLVERLFGSPSFALLYITSGVGGSLCSLLWNPAVNSAGASGAIFGVYGAMLAFFLRRNTSIPPAVVRQQRASGLLFIAFNLMNGFSHAGIDNAAHLGGLSVGLAMGLVLARPLGIEEREKIRATFFYMRGSAVALVIVAVLFMTVRLSPASNAAEQAFRRDLVAMREPEEQAQKAARDAIDKLQNSQMTPGEFADRIEADVLPRWKLIHENIARDEVPDGSKMKALWELMDDYSYSRLAAFRLFDSGARYGKTADFRQARLKLVQGENDLSRIRDLTRGKQPN